MSSANYHYPDQLESARLRTRFLTLADIPAWTAFFKDPEAVELFPNPKHLTDEERARAWIESVLRRYENQQYGFHALIDKQSGNFIGQAGLLLQEVDGVRETEIAYHVFKKYWGNGYAPEAARLFIDFAFQHHIADSLISIIDIRNIRSQRVAEKNGLQREKQTVWSGLNVFIYRISR